MCRKLYTPLNKVRKKYGVLVAFSDNAPLPRPGVYLLLCLVDNRCYVGATKNILRRALDYATSSSGVPEVQKAMRQYGKSQFVFMPLYYSRTAKGSRRELGLHEVEQSLIEAYNSVANGWNRPHPNVARLSALPAAVTKRRLTESSTTTKALRSEVMRARWNDPAYHSRVAGAMCKANHRPERNAKISAYRRGRIWITNGLTDRYIPDDAPVPEGWRTGRMKR